MQPDLPDENAPDEELDVWEVAQDDWDDDDGDYDGDYEDDDDIA